MLATIVINIVAVGLLTLAPWSDWRTGLALNVVDNALLVGFVLFRRDPLLARFVLFGLAVGFAELPADAWLVDATRTLDYSIGGGPMLWRSPAWMPLAWEVVAVQLGYLGLRLRERWGAAGLAAIGLLGALNIPYYEEMATRIHWWSYTGCRMLSNTPYYIILGELGIAVALALLARPLRRRGPLAAVALGVCGGLSIFACYGLAFGVTDGWRGARETLGARSLLHLEDEIERATVTGGTARAGAREQVWRFDEPRPDWHPIASRNQPWLAEVTLEPLADRARLSLGPPAERRGPLLIGGITVELEPSPLEDWALVLVRARSHERLGAIAVSYNVDEEGGLPGIRRFFLATDESAPVFSDGSEQTYSLPLRAREGGGGAEPVTLRNLGLFAGAPQPASLELVSVTLVPRAALFAEDRGVRPVTRAGITRRTLFAHTPAAFVYPVKLQDGSRVDFGLGAVPGDPVLYRVLLEAGDKSERLFEERVEEGDAWQQRSVDLAGWAGRRGELTLEARSERDGAVALWGAPVLSDRRPAERPNIIFYVIDGGGADLMSLYGYARPTTPFLEQLAAEGVVFEHAYSNSTWTQPSTASFMTSLHHSVLGGLRRGMHSTPVPAAATTMAEHMRRGGYETAVFTSNPNCARLIGLERGVDFMRDGETEHASTSSSELHQRFFEFRAAYPGEPYWVHFQTTDVHEPNEPVPPFAGRFVSAEDRERLGQWHQRLFQAGGAAFGATSIVGFYDQALERAGLDRRAYFELRRGLYDETMAYQDEQLRQFVEKLKADGEWERTLFVIAADHGHPAGTFARFGRGLIEPPPEPWEGALFDSYNTRVPLVFVWPGHIAGGRRVAQPVSMIDVLPTLLELAGLPAPEVAQGRSLAPLLFGCPAEAAPVIFDEFRVDEATGEMVGNLEIIDGRWGASLEIGPLPPGADPTHGRHAVPAGGRWGAVHPFFPEVPRLLLYDLEQDPFATHAVNDAEPERVERYRKLLLEHWEAHRALAQRFREGAGATPLSPEQLQQLRALGYIQ